MHTPLRLELAAGMLLVLASQNSPSQPKIPKEYTLSGFAIGCQAYTFNRFTVFEAIEKTAQAGGRIIAPR